MSCILKYLLEAQYTVVCFLGNVGQEENWGAVREKAMEQVQFQDFVQSLGLVWACESAIQILTP